MEKIPVPYDVDLSVPPLEASGSIGVLEGDELSGFIRLARIVIDAYRLNPPNVRW